MKACEIIVRERKTQLEDCKKELLKKLHEAVKMEKEASASWWEVIRATVRDVKSFFRMKS